MLLFRYAAMRQPKGMKHLVVADSPASMDLWVQSSRSLLKKLPQATQVCLALAFCMSVFTCVQDAIEKHEAAGTTDSPDFQEAFMEFVRNFTLTLQPWPEEFTTSMKSLATDSTVYHTMYVLFCLLLCR